MPMPTVVKGHPLLHASLPMRTGQSRASSPDENQAESLRRVVPDENQAELLRRVAPRRESGRVAPPRRPRRESGKVTLHVTPDEHRGSVAPIQRGIRESGNPPTVRKTITPSGLTGKNDTPETIPTDFPRKCHRRGQTNNLPRGKMRSKSRPPKANG